MTFNPLQSARRALRRSALGNRALIWLSPLYRQLGVRSNTQVVIEGYPRCANTFAYVAFTSCQPTPLNVAHHLHSLGQLRRGVQLKIPTLVLLREPSEAILSVTIRKRLPSVDWALDEYIDFHQGVVELGDAVTLADFREVTGDFGLVIRRLNRRFGTQFAEFEHTEKNVAACYAEIDEIEEFHAGEGKVRSTHVARPSQERHAEKQQYAEQLLAPARQQKLAEAQRLYAALCAAHSIHLVTSAAPT